MLDLFTTKNGHYFFNGKFLMGFLSLFTGRVFQDLLQHGKSALQGLSPLQHALSFFVPSLIMTGALIVISVLLARGMTSGLLGVMAVFIILLVVTLAQGLHLLFSHDGSLWPLVIASFALILCRGVMNSSGFVLFTLFCRTQRLASVAREIRLKSR
ncbi:hypothetical protein [Enterobacter cloacae]|uniref:hypothetical protein n=1 Tax=Enterobacter cloacae TaxID=550 RepID=UPI0034A5684B